MEQPHPSVRAASWLAAQCVRQFCRVHSISHQGIEAFCRHLEDAAVAESLVAWDAESTKLEVTGLGDPLPTSIGKIAGLSELLCAAREVTASQMYAAWTPHNVAKYLSETAERSGLDPEAVLEQASRLHVADRQGWGFAVSQAERGRWSREA